ncbi:zinc ribbon domain-containing protein [Streptosporangium sp. NPDC051022]|uniref:zinc ribbon domain-containing protein n=1 Tax=Streptosporangium sp. NPDC051022 TaxID=3155752 RepID=UPI00342E940F
MRRFGLALALLGGLTLATAATTPALAHEHPSGITDLVTPAVVRVEATARVDITLLDHIGELVHVERSYEVPIGSGSGTVVNPEGGVVTLTRVVKNDKDIAVYAANKIFAEHHKVKIPDDFERHTLKDHLLNHHLQECYPPKQPTATCIVDVTTEIRVFPNISPPDKEGFKAEIVRSGDRPDSPAVLMPVGRADGSAGLPTAPLAAQVPGKEVSPVEVAGFTGRPAVNLPETVEIAHLKGGGAGENGRGFGDPENKVDEPQKVGALVDRGLLGGPVIEDKKGEVVGLLVGGGKDGRMIGIREVTKALAEAKVVPRRGPIDAAFEQALTRFHTHYYGDAVPAFQRVLDLYPGHTVAAAHLRTAQQKRGTAEDEGAKKADAASGGGAGLPLWPFVAGGALLVLAVLAGAFLLWRRRDAAEDDAPEEEPEPDRSGERNRSEAPGPLSGPPPAALPLDGPADPTVVVGRSFPALPRVTSSSTSPGRPVLVARDPGAEPAVRDGGTAPGARDGGTVPGLRETGVTTGAREAGVAPAAWESGARPADAVVQKYCTACGMRLGPAHRFCGYCGHPSET